MRRTLGGVIAVVAILLASCGNAQDTSSSPTTTSASGTSGSSSSNAKFPAVNQPGVTADAINVGGIASVTNPVGGKYGDSFNGVQAYFDMVNSQGGVYGRQL